MSASYHHVKGTASTWQVTVSHHQDRVRVNLDGPEWKAQAYCADIETREQLHGENCVATIRAEREAAKVAAQQAKVTPTTFPTVQQALEQWLDRQEQAHEIRVSTAKTYRNSVENHCYPTLGLVPLDQLTREQLGAMIEGIKATGHGLSIIRNTLNPLRGLYRNEIEHKRLTVNPTERLGHFVGRGAYKRLKRVAKENAAKYWPPEEQAQILGAAEAVAPRWRLFIMLGLWAGLRFGECVALVWRDIDWTRGRIHVCRTWADHSARVEPCKDSEDRWVKASPALLAALQKQQEVVALEAQVKEWDAEQRALVNPNRAGGYATSGSFYRTWKRILAAAQVRYLNFHATRHSYATTLLNDGANLQWVSEQLGHADISLTAGVYGHLVQSKHEDAVKVFDRILDSSGK